MNRFFYCRENLSLSEILEEICHPSLELVSSDLPEKDMDSRFLGNDKKVRISGISTLKNALKTELTFFNNPKYKDQLSETKAAACFIKEEFAELLPKYTMPVITENPYRALANALKYCYKPKYDRYDGKTIERNIFIGNDTQIGKNVTIGFNTIIGPGVTIGDHTKIGSNVILENTTIGEHCVIDDQCIIGSESIGFDMDEKGRYDVMQIGSVAIGNHVRIGTSTTIDRGSLEDTVVGDYTALGSALHIAHNVHIGKGCIVVTQTGIAGSTIIGDHTMIGGQVGIAGHLKIGNRVQLAARSGLMHDIPDGEKWAGIPAMPANDFFKMLAKMKKL